MSLTLSLSPMVFGSREVVWGKKGRKKNIIRREFLSAKRLGCVCLVGGDTHTQKKVGKAFWGAGIDCIVALVVLDSKKCESDFWKLPPPPPPPPSTQPPTVACKMKGQSEHVRTHCIQVYCMFWHRLACSVGAYEQNFCVGAH